MRVHVTHKGHEVEGPLHRAAVIALAFLSVTVGLVGAALFILVVLPICLLLYLPLRCLGRRGTIRRTDDTLHINLDREAFQWR